VTILKGRGYIEGNCLYSGYVLILRVNDDIDVR